MAVTDFNGSYQIDWDFTVTSQSVANNTSTVYGRLIVRKTGGSGFHAAAAPAFSISGFGPAINGNWGPYDFRSTSQYTLWSGTRTFTHAADGTLNLSTNASVDMYNQYSALVNGTRPLARSLPTIARASKPTINGGGEITAGSPMTMNFNRASSSFSHIIRLYLGDYAAQVGITPSATWTWTPPVSLLSELPDTTNRWGFFTVLTMRDSVEIGRTNVPIRLLAGATAVPNISSVSLADGNSTVASVVGAYVQGLSTLKATVNATGYQGSTLTERTFAVDGQRVDSGEEIPLDVSGSRPVTARVTDTRGRTDSWSGSVSVLAYAPVRGTLLARRATSAGSVSDTGTYIRIDMTAVAQSLSVNSTQKNDLTVAIATRQTGTSTWTNRTVTQPTGLTHNTNFLVSGGGIFATTTGYDVRLTVTDKFGSATYIDSIATATILMDWNGEAGLGVGKFHTQGVLDVGGNTHIDGELYVKGFRTAGYHFNTNVTQPPQDYPLGATVGDSGSGWPSTVGIVHTVRYSDSRTYQECVARSGGVRWWRGVDNSGGPWVWTAWRQIGWSDTEWVSVGTLSNSFGAGDNPPEYRLKGGVCYLRGGLTRATAPTGQGAFTLPTGARPTTPIRITTRGANTEIIIDVNGVVSVVSPTALGGAGYTLGGVSYPID